METGEKWYQNPWKVFKTTFVAAAGIVLGMAAAKAGVGLFPKAAPPVAAA